MDNYFIKLYNYISKHKVLSFILLFLYLLLTIWMASKLRFKEDITQLIPHSKQSDITKKVLENVSFSDKIIIHIQQKDGGTLSDLTNAASAYVDSLHTHSKPYIKEIQGIFTEADMGNTLDVVYEHLPLFLTDKDYEKITGKLSPDSLANQLIVNYKSLISPSGIITRNQILKDPLGLTFLGVEKLNRLKANDSFNITDNFLVSKDNKHLLLFVIPKYPSNETARNTVFVNQLKKISTAVQNRFEDRVSVSLYGTTVVAVANAKRIKTDIQLTVSIALSVLFVLLIYFYRKLLLPLILFLPTIFGGLTAVSFLYLVKGEISAISLGIGAVLLGITLDYALHILTHYRNNPSATALYRGVSKPIIMSSLTTAVAFLCLLFLQSDALADLGIFAAISVLASAFFALVLVPHLYRVKTVSKPFSGTFIDKIAAYPYHRNVGLVGILLFLMLGSLFTYNTVQFNNNLAALNYQSPQLLKTEKALNQLLNTQDKSIYVIAYANEKDSALAANLKVFEFLENAKTNHGIKNFNAVGNLLLPKAAQQERIDKWKAFWTPEKQAVIKSVYETEGAALGFKAETFDRFYTFLNKDFEQIDPEFFTQKTNLPVSEFYSTDEDGFTTVLSLIKLDDAASEDLVQTLNKFPKTLIIDRQSMNETFLGNLKERFSSLIGYSVLAVIIMLLLFFRNVELTLNTIFPIGITWLITLGLMGLFQFHFNIFNIIITTFIFGLGIDYSIFMTQGLRTAYTTGKNCMPTYKTAILLSVITTLLSMGALIFAKHPALHSIALISLIGILTALFVAYTIQPVLFNFTINWRNSKGLAPLRLRTFLHAMVLFVFYGLGGMLLSVLSFIIIPLLPISKKKKMKWLHETMAKLVTAVLYGNPFVKKKVINTVGEDFKKPAVIIANHASFLDTLTIGMVTPNVIYLVNDWVYKSPVFGLLARVTGFYPVSSGLEGGMSHLQKKIKQGYCLVVFPEASRSYTNKTGRFHKGAFHIAKELKLDILPLYLHGNAEVLPKRDFIIYDGSLTVTVGKRIAYNDDNFGKTARERTKRISAFFKAEYKKIRKTLEGPDYFRETLLNNYRYKTDKLLERSKADFKQNKQAYYQLMRQIPYKTKILHIADNFGQIDILLVSDSVSRKITSVITDDEKRKIAENCYTAKHRGVTYADNTEGLIFTDFKILLISSPNYFKDKEVDFSNFLHIGEVIIFKKAISESKFIKNDYEKIVENNLITVLKKK
ncbi:MAG: glycerol acyltransferase [Flavobacteriales bacterium]|nr:MAG: glycerol acyltransferase [Flavobacteriales bacterium]